MTPVGRRRITESTHPSPRARWSPMTVRVSAQPDAAATSRTPSMISSDGMPSSPLSTSSTAALRRPLPRRRYPLRRRWSSTCARVVGATSLRPFSTFDIVVRETPASTATEARVTRRSPVIPSPAGHSRDHPPTPGTSASRPARCGRGSSRGVRVCGTDRTRMRRRAAPPHRVATPSKARAKSSTIASASITCRMWPWIHR